MVNVSSWEDKTTKTGKNYVLATLESGEKAFVWSKTIQESLRAGNTQIEGKVEKNEAGFVELKSLEEEKKEEKVFKSRSTQIKELSDRKHEYWTAAGLSANLGGLMHDAYTVLSQQPDFRMLPDERQVERAVAYVEMLFVAKSALEKRIHGDERPL